MRVIAGRWRGRKLVAPPGGSTRPTADRTRETLFSMLVSRLGSLEDLAVADLYAGSGALGIEALSRGAASAMFVETDPAARRAIENNLASLHSQDATVAAHSAERLPKGCSFDLIFADPPYGPASGDVVVRAVAASDWLVIETARRLALDPGPVVLDAERDTGPARLTLLRRPA